MNSYNPLRLCLSVLVIFSVFAAASKTCGQGVVLFANDPRSGINAPFYESDGFKRLAGPGYTAVLYGGRAGTPPNRLAKLAESPFRSGRSSGYWISKSVVVPNVPVGQVAALQVRFFDNRDGAIVSFDQAERLGAKFGLTPVLNIRLAAISNGVPPVADPRTNPPVVAPSVLELPIVGGLMAAGREGAEILGFAAADADKGNRLMGLTSSTIVPTLTLSRGVPRKYSGSGAFANGPQTTDVCGSKVGINSWFKIVCSSADMAVINTTNSLFDTVVAGYKGSILDPQQVACNDDMGDGVAASEIRFPYETNQLCLLMVAGKDGASGELKVNYMLETELRIMSRFPEIQVSWPADATDFVLESAKLEEPGSWSLVPGPFVTIGIRRMLKFGLDQKEREGEKLYRLRRINAN